MHARASHNNLVYGIAAAMALAVAGCSRTEYRLQADCEAYDVISERSGDPRWSADDYSIDMDPRSRYFEVYDPDRSPMPPDDPVSHSYMHIVDGKDGWEHWHDNGDRAELENPSWRDALASYVTTTDDGAVELNLDSALDLAYMHAPLHQRQLETLYLSALDVTTERFRLDTQFFGGYGPRYTHNGRLIRPILGRSVTHPSGDAELNRLRLGGDPTMEARRRFSTAGELLVGFANSFVFEFTGGDANLATSIANFSFIQPLLRGAGRDIALESLTFNERKLLAGVRAYAQFRQGFYTQVAIGELGVTGPQRGGPNTTLQSFSGSGGVGGYLGILQQSQIKQNSIDNLSLQERTLERLLALYDNELIDLVQVDQYRQSVETQRSDVINLTNSLELALDNYKTGTLGLPSSLPIDVDETLIRQFQLFPETATPILDSLIDLQKRLSQLPDDAEVAALAPILEECSAAIPPVTELFELARRELDAMDSIVPDRERSMDDDARTRFEADRQRLRERLADLENDERFGFKIRVAELESLRANLDDTNRQQTLRTITSWVQKYLQIVERLSLVPAQARLERIMVRPIALQAPTAFQIALANRLDFMNGRAALVDRWRQIEVTADALQSSLDLTVNGELATGRNNPVSFRAPTSTMRMGLQFDAPFTRLLERNAYREAIITYEQNRRSFIQSRDNLEKGLRALIRNLELNRQQLEVQRRAVTIAIRRVDQTQLSLSAPPPEIQPGGRVPINPTTAINLQLAQSALQTSQNSFLAAWMRYYASRLRLYRELGIMELDDQGRWIEKPLDELENPDGSYSVPMTLPPDIPFNVLQEALRLERNERQGYGPASSNSTEPLDESLRQLPPARIPPAPALPLEQVNPQSDRPTTAETQAAFPSESPPADPNPRENALTVPAGRPQEDDPDAGPELTPPILPTGGT